MDEFIVIGIVMIIIGIVIIYILYQVYLTRQYKTGTETGMENTIITHKNIGKKGDMENQLFQIATLYSIAKKSKCKMCLPKLVQSLPIYKLFNIEMFEYEDIMTDIDIYEQENYENIVIANDSKKYNINGYRQAYKYFDEYKSEIQKIFEPKKEVVEEVRKKLPKKYIAIHIRKGDYEKFYHKWDLLRGFAGCDMKYYKNALDIFLKMYSSEEPKIIVCTDSPKLVRPLIKSLHKDAIMAPVYEDIPGKFSDFCVLYLADCLICSNSTYSWMAGYLRDKNVIIPYPWWNPKGFVDKLVNLNGPYLAYYEWILLDPKTGIRYEEKIDDNNDKTLYIYKLMRGFFC